ncbi:DUF262 domain-containing protein [Kosakonia cowanii]|uniref:DUF262 domain-containing protein n=1 Tax=Kosakonia cowanii TaxID=208223 RepID=UPI0025A98AC4|nr:DUF262 domain-containing protein [Kosakonia cowanii]MDM9616865.1 DUF262 domain-containing protein [Kosakonia cowanii]MDP4561863.1 DUF262 domain-containing protein [Kosakonia cowanii]
MTYEDILNDIEMYLVGKELQPITPNTSSLFLIKVDREKGKYYVTQSLGGKIEARSTNEIKSIFDDLNRKGFCSVDQALYGSGSSRNQPETIFANLPYIQYFKYQRKKHILIRDKIVHEPGMLSELQGGDFRIIRKQVENYLGLNLYQISVKHYDFLRKMYDLYDSVLKKYPGEISVVKIKQELNEISALTENIADSIVTLDYNKDDIKKKYKELDVKLTDEDEGYISFGDIIDNPESIGVDSGTIDDEPSDKILELKTNLTRFGLTKIRTSTPVLSLIFDRVKFGDIELQPDFQRKDRIWKDDKKSKLIESILMRLPLPVFYFGEKTDGTWIIVDGLQRITTIYDFIRGDFSLNDLNVLNELNGKEFKDLSRTEQRDIREYSITAYHIEITPESTGMIVELFHRINTYGVKLSDQEIRSALNQGSCVKFLRYFASLNIFKSATQHKVKFDRQKDMELCLSALSFMVQGYKNYGQNSYNDFLTKTMEYLNKFDLSLVDANGNLIANHDTIIDNGEAVITIDDKIYFDLARRYSEALSLARSVFGAYAFIKDVKNKRAPISKQLFELIVTYFSFVNEEQRKAILENSAELVDLLYFAIEENSTKFAHWDSSNYVDANRGFRDSISTSTGKRITVIYRFEAFSQILEASTGVSVEIIPLME